MDFDLLRGEVNPRRTLHPSPSQIRSSAVQPEIFLRSRRIENKNYEIKYASMGIHWVFIFIVAFSDAIKFQY